MNNPSASLSLLHHKRYGTDHINDGSKLPLVILHGLMGSGDNWHQIATDLAIHRHVITTDLRNHGRSFHAPPHSLVAMAQDIEMLTQALKLKRFVLMGHSMGGKAALQYAKEGANKKEQALAALIVVDVATRAYSPAENKALLSALAAVSLKGIRKRSELNEAFATVVTNHGMRQFLLKNLTRNAEGDFHWLPNLPLLIEALPHYMGEIPFIEPLSLPCLLLKGRQSHYVQEEDLSVFQNNFEPLSIQTMDTGHWPHSEQPERFVALLEAFFKQLNI